MLLGLQVELGDEPVVVGRASDCAISLPHPSVSRHHCRIWREGDAFWIEDCGSTNHTYLNSQAITRAQLRDGDQISVGSNAIKFFVGSSVEATYHDELIDLAIYDSLTGFFNRRHFCAVLDEELEKTVEAAPLSLLMMDLDHFKEINDSYGHLVGDQVLERGRAGSFVSARRWACRSGAWAARNSRWHCPDRASAVGESRLAEALRNAIEERARSRRWGRATRRSP